MPSRVALITSASLLTPSGGALRVLAQARGLWAAGWRDFVLFSREPDPRWPFAQDRVQSHGPLELISETPPGFSLYHAHQNAGLFLRGRVWADLHGFAPVESLLAWRERPWSPRASLFLGFSSWATRRLLHRADRVICAAGSIVRDLPRAGVRLPPVSVIRNSLDVGDYAVSDCRQLAVGVIGGFTSRWGRPAFDLALAVARHCPGWPFQLIGPVAEEQRRQAATLPHVTLLGRVDEVQYRAFLRDVSVVLMPYPDWCAGGGSRLKLLEAAAAGLAVVSTPSGVCGFEPPPEVLVAREPQTLAALIQEKLGDADERRRRGAALRRHVEQQHDLYAEGRRLGELYEAALSGASPA